MNRLTLMIVLSSFVLLATAFSIQSKTFSLKTTVSHYRIYGSTERELRSSLNNHPARFSPPGNPSVRFPSGEDAHTWWYVTWHYDYQRFSGGCRLTRITVRDDVTILLPEWHPLAGTSSALVSKWNTYLRNLRRHENGHEQNSITASTRIASDLHGLSSFPSCPVADATANRLGYARIKQANHADVTYDARTRHGATQGAVFP